MKGYIEKYKDLFLLFVIVIIALVLRLYRITEQSIWHEEFIYVANIKICDLWTNIKLLFINVPEYGISPGGLVLYYFWIRLFPEPIWVWRLLPICFGIFSIVLLYYFGKWIKGWKIGFFAGLLMAISPLNIYIHQELKSYSFVLFLSLLSWYAFLNYLETKEKRHWLWIGACSNFLLPWFHALYIAIPMIQFPLFLSIFEKKKESIHKISRWIIINVIVLIPFILWEYWVNPPAYNLTLTVMEQLTPKFIIASLFGIDCVGISNELLPHWKTNTIDIVKNHFCKVVLSNWVIPDYCLLILIILCVVFFFFYTIRSVKITRSRGSNVERNFYLLYIFLFSSIPFLCMRLITGEPFFLPLYFYHSFAFLYIIISYVLFVLNNSPFRIFLPTIFIILYFVQCLSLINFTSRPDYKSAVTYMEKNVKKDDTVLDLELGANVFEPWKIYKQREDYKFIPVFSLQAIADIAKEKLSDVENDGKNHCLWVLMETTFITWIYNVDPTYLLVKYLSPLGLKVNIKHFPGKFNLYVLKIERDIYKEFKEKEVIIPPFNDIDYSMLMEDFNIKTDNEDENKRREYLLYKYFPIRPPFFSYSYILILGSMLQDKEMEIAIKICSYLIDNYPEFYHAMFIKGFALYYLKEKEKAMETIQNLFNSNYIFKTMYVDIWNNRDVFMRGKKENITLVTELEKKGYHILNRPIMAIMTGGKE